MAIFKLVPIVSIPAAVLLAILAAACGRRPAVAEIDRLLSRAQELESKGLEGEAVKALEAFASPLAPGQRGRLALAKARLHHRMGAFDLALGEAQAAAASEPGAPEILYLQGDCLRRLDRLSEAAQVLGRLLDVQPDNRLGKLSLASVRLRSSAASAALPLFESYFQGASSEEPQFAEGTIEYARALRELGRFQEAADRLVGLLERDPLESVLYSELASTLYRLRLRDQARLVEGIYKEISQNRFEEHVEEGLIRTGSTAFGLSQRASNRSREKRFLQAFQNYRQALEIDPGDARIRLHHADLCLRFRRFQEALRCLEDGTRRGARPASGLWWAKAKAHLEARQPEKALAACREGFRALAQEGDSGGVERGQAPLFPLHLYWARSALEAGSLEEAERAAAAAAGLAPGSWEPFYWRGRIAMARGQESQALAHFDEAVKAGGQNFLELHYYRGLAFERLGRLQEAAALLEKIAALQPSDLEMEEPLLRLVTGDPARAAALHSSAATNRQRRERIEALEQRLGALPLDRLQESGEIYLELGKLHLERKDLRAFDFLFLASDLLPENPEAVRLILSGLKRPQDVFVRLHFLKRRIALEADAEEPLAEVIRLYLQFHVRLDEAARLASRLHERRPSALSYRLRAEAALAAGEGGKARSVLQEGRLNFPADPGLESLAREMEKAPNK